jgi:hypothetical protein
VDPNAYSIFVQALTNGGQQSALDQVPMGSLDPSRQEKFVNPCSGVCFDLQGADSHHLTIPPAPGVSSAEAAGEMVELYWHASLAMCLSPNSIRAPPPRLLRPS